MEIRKSYLALQGIYQTEKIFTENLLAKEMKKTEILMNNSACLGLSVLELSKKLMFELYDFLKPNYGEKLKLCYVDT